MKKIFLPFAAAAVLVSSCMVEENTLVSDGSAGIVTIRAVASDTKTALNETNDILWENGDEILLLLNYDTYKDAEIFTTELSAPGSSADFTAELDLSDIDKAVENVNALYPADAYSADKGITFTVLSEQDGIVGSKDNLSYALLTKTALVGGNAVAQFKNVLSLIKVTVPAGIAKLELVSNGNLTGTGTFKFDDNGVLYRSALGGSSSNNTVSLSNTEGLAAGTYDVLVYPGDVKTLTLKLTGVDGAEYEKTLSKDDNTVYMTLEASKSYNLNIINLFSWEAETTIPISPLGGEVKISAATTADNTYSVSSSQTWIRYVETRAFHGDDIILTADANDTGASREAEVTVSYGNKSRVFTVTQGSVFMDIVKNAEGETIQWQESFGVYGSEADAKKGTNVKKGPYTTNTFTISLSDDFDKGTYVIDNMFYAESYYDANGQPAYTKGAKYYADFKDNTLIVKKNFAGNSYYFSNSTIELVYDSADQTFTVENPIPTTASDLWIGGYTASVKVDDSEDSGESTEGSSIENLTGFSWKQSADTYSGIPNLDDASAVTFTKIDETHVSISNLLGNATISSAEFNSSTMTLTVPSGWTHPLVGSPTTFDIVFNVSEDYKTIICATENLSLASWAYANGYKLTRVENN